MTDYNELAARAERGGLAPVRGTVLRGEAAAEAARAALMEATGTATIEDAVTIARGRPRIDAAAEEGPMWKVRATVPLDRGLKQLAALRGVSKSQILREAADEYLKAHPA